MTREPHVHVAMLSAAVLGAMLLAAPVVLAQNRFRLESRDVLSDSSLVICTIRDSQLSTCYTLFVVEPPPAAVPAAAAAVTTQPDGVEAARAARDEQLAALRIRVAARPQFDRVSQAAEDEAARRKIEDVFESAVRGVPMMSTLPWDAPKPGIQTGGYQYQAEEIRRSAIDPTTARSLIDSSHAIESWLMKAAQAPRMAATGPVPCKPTVAKSAKP